MKTFLAIAVSVLLLAVAGFMLVRLRDQRATLEAESSARITALSQEVAALRSENAALKSGELTPSQRQSVLQLIAEDRAEQLRKQQDERQRIFEQHSLAWVDQMTKANGLTDEQRRSLLEVVSLSRERAGELSGRLSASAVAGDLDALNKIYQDVKTWRLAELTKRLGSDTAERINKEAFWLATWEPNSPNSH